MANTSTTYSPPRISVVIPTFNRAGRLQACLQALSEGFLPDAEVIVVSDGGDRSLFPNLSRFETCLNPNVIHTGHGGPAAARNVGLERAKAPIVAFIDDDCLPQSDWLRNIAAAMVRVRRNFMLRPMETGYEIAWHFTYGCLHMQLPSSQKKI